MRLAPHPWVNTTFGLVSMSSQRSLHPADSACFFQMPNKRKNKLHVLLPKTEDCASADEWKQGWKTRHAIHTVTSGSLINNHNPKTGSRERKMEIRHNAFLLLSSTVYSTSQMIAPPPFFCLLLHFMLLCGFSSTSTSQTCSGA